MVVERLEIKLKQLKDDYKNQKDRTDYHKEYSEQLFVKNEKLVEKHKKEIAKLKMKEIERSHNPQGDNDDLAQ